MGHLLDDGDIDYAILDIFEELVKYRHTQLGGNHEYFRNELVHSFLFQALFDLNIIWKSKYYEYFQLEHALYFMVVEDWISTRKSAMTQYELAGYWLYRKQYGIKLDWKSGVPEPDSIEKQRDLGPKYDY